MTNPNDPAFAHHEVWDNDKPEIGWIGGGLTKREYFAAMVMQGILSSGKPPIINGINAKMDTAAVIIADALIAELNKDVPSA